MAMHPESADGGEIAAFIREETHWPDLMNAERQDGFVRDGVSRVARAARMSAAPSLGYASRRSSIAAPSASLRNRSSTGIRVPRITALPCMTLGLISTRSVMVQIPLRL
jgi:hypothetical protein